MNSNTPPKEFFYAVGIIVILIILLRLYFKYNKFRKVSNRLDFLLENGEISKEDYNLLEKFIIDSDDYNKINEQIDKAIKRHNHKNYLADKYGKEKAHQYFKWILKLTLQKK